MRKRNLTAVLMGLSSLVYCGSCKTRTEPSFVDRGIIAQTESSIYESGVSVALGDLDKDGDLDAIVSTVTGIKYFENVGNGKFSNHGIIGQPEPSIYKSGVGIAIGDIDGDGDLDFISASVANIKYFENVSK